MPEPINGTDIPKVLVLSGGEDDTATEIMDLEMTLDSIGAEWEITRYSDIDHAFTVFADDRYNAFADMRSWYSIRTFLEEVFGEITYEPEQPMMEMGTNVTYVDVDGTELQGFLSIPDSTEFETPAPCVVILPDWDGNNEYERERATLFAKYGYVAMAADIYGADKLTVPDFDERRALADLYRSNSTLFVQRIQRAVDELKEVEECNAENMALAGYCFGGTGVIQYAFADRSDIKAIASFHGGLTSLPQVENGIVPYTLM